MVNGLTGPTAATIKQLFALSGNKCAFPKCTSTLVEGNKVVGKICHIKARNEGGPRFDSSQTPEERHGRENLILMCGRHHDVIDDDEEAYTVDRLHQLKAKHEQNATKLSDNEVEQGTKLIMLDQSVLSTNQSGGFTAQVINIHNYPRQPIPIESSKFPKQPIEEPSIQGEPKTAPHLKISRLSENVIFDHMRSSWRLAQQWEPESQTALVVWVENEFPSEGNARDFPNLIASIRAEQHGSLTVPRAYWLDRRDNEVTITSGDRLGILIGYFSGDNFFSYRNPNTESSTYNILDDGFRALGQRSKLLLVLRDADTMPLRITITIAQMPSQTVIACKRLIIKLPEIIVGMQECQ